MRVSAYGHCLPRHWALPALLLLLLSPRPAAAEDRRYQFNIPAQSLAEALKAFGISANEQLIFSRDLVDKLRSAPLVGTYPADQGLAQLLAGTGLLVNRTSSGVILLRGQRSKSSPAPAVSGNAQENPSAPLSVSERKEPSQREAEEETEIAGETLLGEVVVTATKQADTVNRVALNVTAVTQAVLEQEGIKNVEDLARTLPSVTFRRGADNSPNVAIRGISSTTGAPTTGVYLDDTPIQKRNVTGVSNGNGTPFPQLFDLERVEVLRGPQGTLYGGSSEGGTIRFITPAPSLTRYSAYVRGEAATTEEGTPSGELGVAVGGPIVQDKLGFRASIWDRHTGGYIDHTSRFTGQVLAADTNSQEDQAQRIALLWAPTPDLKITPAFYHSYEHIADVDVFWENIPQYTTPAMSYNAAGQPITATNGPVAYTHPAHTYGPYSWGPYKSGLNSDIGDNYAGQLPELPGKQPRSTNLYLPSLTIDYALPFMAVKSVTSLVQDETTGINNYTYSEPLTFTGSQFVFDLPEYRAGFHFWNKRHVWSEELRFSSVDQTARLTWVGGVFYSDSNMHTYAVNAWTTNTLLPVARGITDVQNYGAPLLPGNISSVRDQLLNERELAAFGEANYLLTSKLKLTVGLRAARTSFDYNQIYFGQASGYITPTAANGGITQGSQAETPITPKFGVSYQLTDRDLLYANAAEGYRIGGVNPPVSAVKCAADLAALGQTTTPPTFQSDSVWSYEAGAKARVFDNRAQINSSVFYTQWKNVQINDSLPTCGFGYIINGAEAISRGVDVQGQARVVDGLTMSFQLGYTDAYYSEAVLAPPPPPGRVRGIIYNKGDGLGTPKWQFTVGAQYDFKLLGRDAYLRGDDQYAGAYQRGPSAGTQSYAPDTINANATNFASARLGTRVGFWDLSLFANNLFDSQDLTSRSGGRSGCSDTACTVYRQYNPIFSDTTFRPRTVGIDFSYRY